MKKEQFTPGPWIAHEGFAEQDYVYCKAKESSLIICKVLTRPKTEVRGCPDARLIAAAPELYDKLKEAAYEFCHNCLSLRLDREEDIPMSDELIEKNCPLADNGCFCRAWWALLKKAKGGAK